MYRKHLLLMASLVSVLAGMPGAEADICVQDLGSGGLGPIRVAKGANVPPLDTCTQVTLFDVASPYGISTGSICTTSTPNPNPKDPNPNYFLLFHYTYNSCAGYSYFESATCIINLQADMTLPPDQPTSGDKKSSCNGIFANLSAKPPTTGPVTSLNTDTVVAWICTNYLNVVSGGSRTACLAP